MWLLTVRDLLYRKRQFSIAALGSALVFAMALVLSGVAGGFRDEARRTVAATGAESFVVAPGAGGPFVSFSALPADALATVRRVPGVVAADPLIVLQTPMEHRAGRLDVHLVGHALGGLGTPPLERGRAVQAAGEAVVDRSSGLRVDDRFGVAGVSLLVVGESSRLHYAAGVANVYVALSDAQRVVFAGAPTITAVAVRGRPATLPAGLKLVTLAEARADIMRPLANAVRTLDICVAFLWLVAAVIIGAVSYLSALERLRDFAVLKAIGVPGRRIYGGLAAQSTLASLIAALLAVGLSRGLGPTIPLPLAVPRSAFLVLPVVAVLVGLVASLSGLRQAVRVDPALAFAGR